MNYLPGTASLVEEIDNRLRLRPCLTVQQADPVPIPKRPSKTIQQRSAEFQARLKQDPAKYQMRLAEQAKRSKANREQFEKSATEEERQRRRAMNNERVKKWRAKKKTQGELEDLNAKRALPKTRKQAKEDEDRKMKDRERKRNERKHWSSQKRAAENKKAAMRRAQKKQVAQEVRLTSQEKTPGSMNGERSVAARAMSVCRLNKALPQDEGLRQETIDDFIQQHSREKSKETSLTQMILSAGGLERNQNLQLKRLLAKKLHCMPGSKSKKRHIQKELKLRSDQVKRLATKSTTCLKTQKRQFVQQIKNVHTFFLENSRILPMKRSAGKQPRSVLERTLRTLYQDYLESFPFISFSSFCRYRPKNVRPQAFNRFNQALCEVCENLDLKIKAINSACLSPIASNKDDLLARLLCKKEGTHYRPECIHGRCDMCGPSRLHGFVQPEELEKEVVVRQWSLREVMLKGKSIKKKALVTKTLTVESLLQSLEGDMASYLVHDFSAKWQYQMFNYKKKNVKPGETLMVLDFAENYRCCLQDEAQAAHWNYCQATVHPIVCYYNCPACAASTTESIIIVSDDLVHDAAAVHMFTMAACEHLKSANPNLKLKRLIQYTDGCSAQYKSKLPFRYIQDSKESLGVPIERNYFGSRHGKNPSDGESAVVKNAATRAVKNRQVIIQTAADLFDFGKCNLEKGQEGGCAHYEGKPHYKRKFLFVDSSVIIEERQKIKGLHLTALKGTRAVHSIHAKDGGGLRYRNTTCFCSEEPCRNQKYVDGWSDHHMANKSFNSKQNGCGDKNQEESQSLDVLSSSTLEFLEILNEGLDEPSLEDRSQEENKGIEIPATDTEISPIGALDEPSAVGDRSQEENMEEVHAQMEIPISGSETIGIKKATVFPGAWVAASFPGKINKIFLGTVLEVDGGEASVKFCRQAGHHFTWPLVDDLSWMPLYSLTVVEAPIMDGRERLMLPESIFNKFFR